MLIAAGVLNRALKTLVHLVPKRSTLPLLETVLVEPVPTGVKLTATDLTTEAAVVMPATGAFSACLPARPLLEFVASVGHAADVTMSQLGDVARVVAAGATLDLPSRPAADFPKRIVHAGKPIAVADPTAFLDGLTWVLRAVGCDVTRPQLTGVFFDGDAIVGCDGHRLHRVVVDGLRCPKALVPASAIGFVCKALLDGSIEISVDKETARFSSPSWTVTTRLVDAQFPAYEQVIPTKVDFTMKVDANALEAGIKRVCGRKRHREAPLRVAANGVIKLESVGDETKRSASVDVIDSTHEGDDHVFGIVGRYFADAVADLETATLRFAKAEDPVVIECGGRTAVVMPWRL